MSDDLISRSKLLEELESFAMTITGLNNPTARIVTNQCKKSIIRIIDEQPTAYDVDKVVEQLEKMQVYQFQGKLPDGRVCHFSDAIEIVKSGGR